MEGDPGWSRTNRSAGISIHALRVEGDRALGYSLLGINRISIHALRVEGDKMRNIFTNLHI